MSFDPKPAPCVKCRVANHAASNVTAYPNRLTLARRLAFRHAATVESCMEGGRYFMRRVLPIAPTATATIGLCAPIACEQVAKSESHFSASYGRSIWGR